MKEHGFEIASELPITPSRFWEGITIREVNAELAPWARMTAPPAWRDRPLRQWPAGQPLFKSWILLLGLIPIDLHAFFLQSVDPACGFEERSSSLTNKRWDHSRRIEPTAQGCRVLDRVRFESRMPLVGAVLLPIYKGIFRSRHRVLARKYAEPGN